MSVDLDPIAVAARLGALRDGWVAESVEEGRRRLAAEVPERRCSFAELVRTRLEELRALDDLTRYLARAHGRRRAV